MENTKFILSIDGGGIRGIIPAVLLSEIEKRVTEEIKKEHQNVDIRCADVFDVIAGTSTGSILALGLSIATKDNRPKFDAKYIVDFFKKHGSDVFPDYSAMAILNSTDKLLKNYAEKEVVEVKAEIKNIKSTTSNEEGSFTNTIKRYLSFSGKKTKLNGTENKTEVVTMSETEVITTNETKDVTKNETENVTKNKTEEVHEELIKALNYMKGFENAYNPWKPKYTPDGFEKLLLESFQDTKFKETVNDLSVIIPSYSITKLKCTLFTNFETQYDELFMRDIVQASAAAPTYFPAKQIGNEYFIDGGVFLNNPTVIAYLEAKKKFPNSKFVVVSLGTGQRLIPLESYKDAGFVQWAKHLIDLLFKAELDINDLTMRNLSQLDGSTYYRIQLDMDKNISLNDISEKDVDKLVSMANKIIDDSTDPNHQQLNEIINLLVDECKKKKIFPTGSNTVN